MRNQTSIHPISAALVLALVAGCDADPQPRAATVSRVDAQPLPITDGGSGSDTGGSDGSDTGGSDTGGSDTGGSTDCESLNPEQHGLVLAEDYELPPGSEALICGGDGEPEPNDDGLQPISAWEPFGSCGYIKDVTGFMPPPAVFDFDCNDLVGLKFHPNDDGGRDERACTSVMDASNKCVDEARKQCDAYAAGKGGKANFEVDYKYEKECYYSSAKRVRNLGPIGVVCEGRIDRDAAWTCNVTPVG
jgi:hypothetical protein